MPRSESVPKVETHCMRLSAAAIGLKVPKVAIAYVSGLSPSR